MGATNMAIIIPSAKTYDRQNPKVRDNVIERIEVGAVEVVPDNEYDTPVYNEDILLKQNTFTTETNPQKEKLDYDVVNDPIAPSVINRYWAYAFLDSNAEYCVGTIKIQRLKNNKYISTVNYGTDKWKIESNLVLSKTTYPITGVVVVKNYEEITSKSVSQSDAVSEIVYDFPSMPTTVKQEYTNAKAELVGVSNNTNLTVSYEENEDSFTISYKVLKKLSETKYVGANMSQSSDVTIVVNGEKTEYNAEKIEITIYGNTIGIDLKDKTLYIPETDKTSKKVYSVDGNELLQASNTRKAEKRDWLTKNVDYTWYFPTNQEGTEEDRTRVVVVFENNSLFGKTVEIHLRDDLTDIVGSVKKIIPFDGRIEIDNGYYLADNAVVGINTYELIDAAFSIDEQFEKTRQLYLKGKETATIRCSIGDYYDYNSKERIISIDNSTSKMSFDIGDQVIPMVYGADGKDRPMSTYQDGTSKVFQVLGTKIFYDGAVWQELSLQEV